MDERGTERDLAGSAPRGILRGAFALIACLLATMPVHGGDHPGPSPQFVETTQSAGIDFRYCNGATGRKYMPEPMGSGAAFFDWDGNGSLDLYIVNGAPLPPSPSEGAPGNALYSNRGDGTFWEVTGEAGVGDHGYGMGVAAGDYDNDGDQDLYITNYGPNVLYRNEGSQRFAEVTAAAGVGDAGWGSNTAFVDYDGDGDLDLYAANYLAFDPSDNRPCRTGEVPVYCDPTVYRGQSGVLYRNQGDGTFADVTVAAGLYTDAGRQLGAVFGDCDNDGDADLFVANDLQPNFYFVNNGDGTFADTGVIAGLAYNEEGVAGSAMGADLGDYDNDGDTDVIVATFQWRPNTLYRNGGDGFFDDVTFAAHLGKESVPFLAMTAAFLDYDNDGHQDVFVANGHLDENVADYDPATSYAQRNQLFRNQGDGTFTEVSALAGPGLEVERVSHGAAFGDYDDDGDVDIFVSDSDTPHCTLLRNDGGNGNHYLTIKMMGTRSNRDGIGARVLAVAGDLVQTREVRSSYGYLSSNDVRVHLGLGEHSRVDRLEIRWPSGAVQVMVDVAADRQLTIVEEAP
ncbi:CRTAC1 family protein [Candidatus Latescibacterota bacterium]